MRRKRAYAIHSQTQEEFRMIAQCSQQKGGYFYDDKVRQQIDLKINKRQQYSKAIDVEDKKDAFVGFDYREQDQARIEQEIQLNRLCKVKYKNIVILTNSTKQTKEMVRNALKIQQTQQQEQRILDLLILLKQQCVLRIWIVKQDKSNVLLSTYLSLKHIQFNLVGYQLYSAQLIIADLIKLT